MDKSKIICIDAETTGIDIWNDEILQLSIIDGDGSTLFNEYFKPRHHTTWEKAESINHISPQMVADKKTIASYKEKIKNILNGAELFIGYNLLQFDLPLLENVGIKVHKKSTYDVMLEFAEIYGEYNEHYGNYKWQKLITCADYYNYPGGNFHDSLEDVRATLFCFFKMIS
jgi:DNA polymerase-3 subunit epsilon